MDATYKKLDELYRALLATSDIEEITASATVGSIYDLSGRMVPDSIRSGIYIINGEKVLVK